MSHTSSIIVMTLPPLDVPVPLASNADLNLALQRADARRPADFEPLWHAEDRSVRTSPILCAMCRNGNAWTIVERLVDMSGVAHLEFLHMDRHHAALVGGYLCVVLDGARSVDAAAGVGRLLEWMDAHLEVAAAECLGSIDALRAALANPVISTCPSNDLRITPNPDADNPEFVCAYLRAIRYFTNFAGERGHSTLHAFIDR